MIINIMLWLLFGLGGYFLVLQAYIKLEGNNPSRKLNQLPCIILGPFAIVIGLLLLWDVYTDPPKK